MKAEQIRKFDMLRRVQQCMDDFAVELRVVNATAARRELDQMVREMGDTEREQATSRQAAKGETARQAALRRALWYHHMRPVATIAAAQRDVPGLSTLVMPAKGVKVAVLIQTATAMAEAARACRQVFVENGCPEDFADALLAAAAAVRASIDARAQKITARAQARAGLKAVGSRAHVVLRLLDARVSSVLMNDAKALAGWKSAKRLGRGRTTPIVVQAPTDA